MFRSAAVGPTISLLQRDLRDKKKNKKNKK